MPEADTIAAIATASGSGGIGVVRVSGPACRSIAQSLAGYCPSPRHAAYVPFNGPGGGLIDQGIMLFFPAPHSYTGEDVLELQAHGGPALMQLLLASCIALGARQAQPGEFTQRAFLNDKLDLAQAEAVADVIEASTSEAVRSAVRSLSGEFSRHIHALRDRLIDLRLYVEACLDFPEEEIDFITQGKVAQKLSELQLQLQAVTQSARQGNLLREGIQVVLVGQPNVGKSSLMNRLAGDEVAIVTAQPGTTRDTLRSSIQIDGVPLHLVDTAGLRETDDEVERQGIARTWRALENAHAALILTDASLGIGEAEKSILTRLRPHMPKIWVHNKIDLTETEPARELKEGEAHLYLSAKTGRGIALLQQALLALVGWQPQGEGIFMARARHLNALTSVQDAVSHAMQLLKQPELLAEELRRAQEALNSITGAFSADDLLGEIFGRFCIGK